MSSVRDCKTGVYAPDMNDFTLRIYILLTFSHSDRPKRPDNFENKILTEAFTG